MLVCLPKHLKPSQFRKTLVQISQRDSIKPIGDTATDGWRRSGGVLCTGSNIFAVSISSSLTATVLSQTNKFKYVSLLVSTIYLLNKKGHTYDKTTHKIIKDICTHLDLF